MPLPSSTGRRIYDNMTIRACLRAGRERLAKNEAGGLEAEVLLAHVLRDTRITSWPTKRRKTIPTWSGGVHAASPSPT